MIAAEQQHQGEPAEQSVDLDSLPPVLTVDELSALLRLHRNQVYTLLRAGQIPGVRRLGGTYRVLRDTVLQWLRDGNGQPEPQRRRGR